jgi:hypothetical protein
MVGERSASALSQTREGGERRKGSGCQRPIRQGIQDNINVHVQEEKGESQQ